MWMREIHCQDDIYMIFLNVFLVNVYQVIVCDTCQCNHLTKNLKLFLFVMHVYSLVTSITSFYLLSESDSNMVNEI